MNSRFTAPTFRHRRGRTVTVLLCALVAALAAAVVPLATAGAAQGHAPLKVVIQLPSAGDVSYGIGEVRVGRTSKLAHVTTGQIFAQRIDGIPVTASSSAWRQVRQTTHVYVVAGPVSTTNRSLRSVAFFVVRHTGGAQSAGGKVTFTLPGVTPVTGGYLGRGANAKGYLNLFVVRNAINTAIGNWSRYLKVLKDADAIIAALHPQLRGLTAELLRSPARGLVHAASVNAAQEAIDAATAAHGMGSLKAGGSVPDTLTRQMFLVLVGTLHKGAAYSAVKKTAIVTQFITRELGSSTLAKKFLTVAAQLPAVVPDAYAAAAQEEAKFERIHAPKISRSRVEVADGQNLSSFLVVLDQMFGVPLPPEVVVNVQGPGVVTSSSTSGIECGETESACSNYYTAGDIVTLTAQPVGSTFTGWTNCPSASGTTCTITVPASGQLNVTATFTVGTLAINVTGSGTVRGNGELNLSCTTSCTYNLVSNDPETLTPAPASGWTFSGWTGCPEVILGTDCEIDATGVGGDYTVGATFTQNSTNVRSAGRNRRVLPHHP